MIEFFKAVWRAIKSFFVTIWGAVMGDFWIVKDVNELTQRLVFFEDWLRKNWNWETPVQWKVSPYKSRRSLSQNALFHVWVREMVMHFRKTRPDLTEEQMKTLVKYKFLGTADIVVGKTIIKDQVRETSSLDRGEMLEFMDKTQNWCLDLGVQLTCPADSEFMTLKGG
jgi:hypothetical protein